MMRDDETFDPVEVGLDTVVFRLATVRTLSSSLGFCEVLSGEDIPSGTILS